MKKLIVGITLSLCTLLQFNSTEACTGIKLIAKDGAFINGRTLEFGVEVDISLAVIPRGYAFKGTTPKGEGLSYTAKHATLGAIAFGQPALMDGLNEKGLAVGTFYFPTYASYTPLTSENQSKALSPVEFPNWLLTQFETVEEVKANLSKVVIVPTITKEWGPTPAPFHYIVYDKHGKCLVIEPLEEKLVIHDNPLGTFTNSPDFNWQITNLRNFINLTPYNAKPVTLDGITFKPFGEGSGMVGIPGDFTPPSRFVRAAIFSTTATPSANAQETISQMFHILNLFDIPIGFARSVENDKVYSDQTLFTCVKDPAALNYYYKSYKDQNIKVASLKDFDLNAKDMKVFKVHGTNKPEDVSNKFQPFQVKS
jgi:choloylglycine hydrolase